MQPVQTVDPMTDLSSSNGSEEHGSRRATRTHSFRGGHHDRRPIRFAVKREEMPSKTLIPYIDRHFGEDADGNDGWETSRPSDGGAGTGWVSTHTKSILRMKEKRGGLSGNVRSKDF